MRFRAEALMHRHAWILEVNETVVCHMYRHRPASVLSVLLSLKRVEIISVSSSEPFPALGMIINGYSNNVFKCRQYNDLMLGSLAHFIN